MKKWLIVIVLAVLLCLTVVTGCAETNSDEIPEEARLYLELTLINLETEGTDDVAAAMAMNDVLVELDNDALLNAFYAYQLCEESEASYYWEQFVDTWAAELGSYLEEHGG